MWRLIALATLLGTNQARADTPGADLDELGPELPDIPESRPVLAIDDTRTHGPTARNWGDLGLETHFYSGPANEGLTMFAGQLSLGNPDFDDRDLHDIFRIFTPYGARVRTALLHTSSGYMWAPLTVGFQDNVPIVPIAMMPLLYAHFGVETVVSTPWLSGQNEMPPRPLRNVNAVDTELSENGWSLRPVSAYLRADFLACRSFYAELGAAPELFVPNVGDDEYYLRYHAAVGWSFGCDNRVEAYPPKVSIEYRGRFLLHAGERPQAYDDAVGLGIQFDWGPVVFQPFATTNPGVNTPQYWEVGLRLQVGLAKSPNRRS
jgi:hypothetical protein